MKKNLPVTLSYLRVQRPVRLVLAALVLSACAFGARAESHRAEAQQAEQQQQSVRRTVTGVVTDAAGRPLSGASVIVAGAQGVGTSTDAQGRFSLSVARGARLNISFMGYRPQTVAVGNQQALSVRLEQEVITTQTAVVTGIFTKPRESYTGAATTLTSAQLQEAGGGNLVSALRNLDPTIYVTENILNGSDPNNLPMVTMRGTTALPIDVNNVADAGNFNRPLVILNGFEVPFSRIVDIDENRIETITLLKDANATSLYGTRGANGVIVMTTKQPQKGKLQLSYRGRLNVQAPDLSSYNLMDAREKLEYERLAGLYEVSNTNYPAQTFRNLYNARLLDIERGVNTDWLHYPVRAGFGQDHSIMLEGGEETFRYALNLGYKNNVGVMKGSNRNAFEGGVNFIYQVKKLQFQNDLQINTVVGKNSPYGNFGTYTTINPYFRPYDDNGDLLKNLDDKSYAMGVLGGSTTQANVNNPLWDAVQPQKNTNNSFTVINNFSVDWKLTPNFTLNGKVGVSTSRNRSDVFKSKEMLEFDAAEYQNDKQKYKGSYALGWSQNTSLDAKIAASYNKLFAEKHLLALNVMGNIRQSDTESYSSTAYGITVPDMDFYGSAHYFKENQRPVGNDALTRNVSTVFSANYTFDSRYFVDASGSYEGSSAFGSNNRFAPIYSFGAGWNLHNEKWFDFEKVDVARFKASWGVTSSQSFDPYWSQVFFSDYDMNYEHWGGNNMQGIGNPDLKGPSTREINLGTEWSLFNSRLRLNLDVYNRITTNVISTVDLPAASGFSSYYANIGKVKNNGWELNLNGTLFRNDAKRMSWNVTLIAGHNKNRVMEISESLKKMNEEIAQRFDGNVTPENLQKMTSPAFMYKEGESMNTIFAVTSKGIDPMTGKEILIDLSGNDYFAEQWNRADQVAHGCTDPKIHGSVNTTFRYMGWKLAAYFQYSLGSYAYNHSLVEKVETSTPWLNADKRALYDRWSTAGQYVYYKGIRELSATKPTSRFVMKNNFFQLSQINLSYDVNPEWSSRVLSMQNLTAMVSMADVFHVATIKRERGTAYPFARSFTFTLTARF